jgi:uncharacterized protein (TIGR03083 family)
MARQFAPGLIETAHHIPALGHTDATRLAQDELVRLLSLLRELSDADWEAPTACTLWNVRQVVAHVTGAAASYTNWPEMARQWNPLVQRKHRQPGFSFLDALNQVQVADRASLTPLELIHELERVGPGAIVNRSRVPAWLRAVRLPIPALGVASIGYLTDTIYTRDMWIHRLDICRAVGLPMQLDRAHDGRIVAQIVRDLGKKEQRRQTSEPLALVLDGPAGGVYRLGPEERARAAITLDAMGFAWLSAGRLSPQQMCEGAIISGNQSLAKSLLARCAVPF